MNNLKRDKLPGLKADLSRGKQPEPDLPHVVCEIPKSLGLGLKELKRHARAAPSYGGVSYFFTFPLPLCSFSSFASMSITAPESASTCTSVTFPSSPTISTSQTTFPCFFSSSASITFPANFSVAVLMACSTVTFVVLDISTASLVSSISFLPRKRSRCPRQIGRAHV